MSPARGICTIWLSPHILCGLFLLGNLPEKSEWHFMRYSDVRWHLADVESEIRACRKIIDLAHDDLARAGKLGLTISDAESHLDTLSHRLQRLESLRRSLTEELSAADD
jgi:hypothetical protein